MNSDVARDRYVILTLAQTLYAYFVEGDIVFVGRRKTLDKRVRPTSSIPTIINLTRPTQIVTERITVSSTSTPSQPDAPPAYALALNFVRSTSGGKSLLGKGRSTVRRGYHTFFDENGVLDQEAFERWVGGAVAAVMEGKQN